MLPAMFAAAAGGPPPTTVEGTVSIAGDVSVQGVVEVLNDVLRTPYNKTASLADASTSPTVTFDIPDNKRLIVETISFQATTLTNDVARVFFEPLLGPTTSGPRPFVLLPYQSVVDGGATYLIGLNSVKMRLDSVPGSTNEIRIRRGTGTAGYISATIFGYLVDK